MLSLVALSTKAHKDNKTAMEDHRVDLHYGQNDYEYDEQDKLLEKLTSFPRTSRLRTFKHHDGLNILDRPASPSKGLTQITIHSH